MLAADSLMFAWDKRLTINSLSVNVCQPLLGPVFVRSRKFEKGGCVFHISLSKKIKPSELKLDLTERKEKKNRHKCSYLLDNQTAAYTTEK